MCVGPARTGHLLEVGVLGIDSDDDESDRARHAMPRPVPTPKAMTQESSKYTNQEIERAARLAEEFDPTGVPMDDTSDLRAVATAMDACRRDEIRLREAVEIARAYGRSWGRIATALGVTRQAARERFSPKVPA